MLRFGSKQSLQKQSCLLGLLDLPLVWRFSKISAFCLSGYLSAGLSRDLYVLDFFDFLHVGRNIQKSRPISVEKV